MYRYNFLANTNIKLNAFNCRFGRTFAIYREIKKKKLKKIRKCDFLSKYEPHCPVSELAHSWRSYRVSVTEKKNKKETHTTNTHESECTLRGNARTTARKREKSRDCDVIITKREREI